MDAREIILVLVRWAHAAAALLLVGGSAAYLFILAPSQAGDEPRSAMLRRADAGFKELVDLSLVVFVISGGLLTFDRLSSGAAGTSYVAVLGLKLLVCLLLYRWAFQVRRGRGWHSLEARLMVGAGFLVVFLATVLKTLYEYGLRA